MSSNAVTVTHVKNIVFCCFFHSQVDGPLSGVIYEKKEVSEGQFAFTAKVAGEYKACFTVRGGPAIMLSTDTDTARCMLWLQHWLDRKSVV